MSAAKNRAQVPAFTGCHCMRLRGECARVCGRGADDAEVVPLRAEVATGFTPGRIAPKGIIAGSTRSLRGNADDAEVGASKVILGFDIFRRDIKVCGIDKSRGSALRHSCIY